MITHFADRRLQAFYETGDRRRLPPAMVDRIGHILNDLDAASGPESLDRPAYRLHRLRGDLAGYWAVRVTANWRVIFRFDGADVRDVRLIDYH